MQIRVRAVLFDVDDTLFDRDGAQKGILRVILQELPDVFAGLPAEAISRAFDESDSIAMREHDAGVLAEDFRGRRSKLFLHLLGLDEKHADAVTALYAHRYPTIDAPVAGAVSVVRRLADTFPLGVVSNGFPDVQYTKLATLGIRDLFGCVVLSGELKIAKPDPRIFLHATDLLDTAPEDCLYVGDSYESDVVGAKRAGMHACWFNPRALPAADIKPDIQVHTLQNLLPLLM
jgi:putative hydrolase of the HAD superfamily